MLRLALNEKEIIKQMAKEGCSINTISKILNRNKTTIYYHFRIERGRTNTPVVPDESSQELVGEFIGLFAGDGYFRKTKEYKYRVQLCFAKNDKAYIEDLKKNVLKKLFEKEPCEYAQHNRLNLYYYSKNIYSLIKKHLTWNASTRKTYTVQLKNKNNGLSFLIGFIRGCLDSDGHYSKNKICFATVSQELGRDISASLNSLKIGHKCRTYTDRRKNRRPIEHITIARESRERFIRIIKPRNLTRT